MAIEKIFVLDTETSLHNTDVGKFLAHPASPDNWVVWLGVQELDMELKAKSDVAKIKYPTKQEFKCGRVFPAGSTLLVGHNIGFDLLHLCNGTNKNRDEWVEFINHPDAMIWDTQIAAYRLSGQTDISPSLDVEAERRKWLMKPGRLKEYWENGISTEDIPDDEVRPYLKHDVATTGELFKQQLAEAAELGMLKMLRIEMKSRLTTLVMEYNGMSFDQKQARIDCAAVLRPLREQAETNATERGATLFGLPKIAVKANSPHFLKAVLYGGTVKWKEQRPMVNDHGNAVYFKTGKKKGQLKTKWTDLEQEVPAFSPVDLKITDDETLVKIIDHNKCPAGLANFLEEVRTFRDGQKQEKTYFTGYSDLTWPDGMIHGNLNHAITATGRLSSSNP